MVDTRFYQHRGQTLSAGQLFCRYTGPVAYGQLLLLPLFNLSVVIANAYACLCILVSIVAFYKTFEKIPRERKKSAENSIDQSRIYSGETLIAGGFFSVISYIFTWIENQWLYNFALTVFLASLIMLFFNRIPEYIKKMQKQCPKMTIYLQYLGVPEYMILFITLGDIFFSSLDPELLQITRKSEFTVLSLVFNLVIYGSALGMATYKSLLCGQKQTTVTFREHGGSAILHPPYLTHSNIPAAHANSL